MSVTLQQIERLLLEKDIPSAILEDRQQVVVAMATKVYKNKDDQNIMCFTLEPEDGLVKIQMPGVFYVEEEHLHSFIGVLEAHVDARTIDIMDLVYFRDTKAINFSIKPAIVAKLPLSSDTLRGLIYVLYSVFENNYPLFEEATHGCTCEPITLVSREMLEQLAASLEKGE